MAVVAVTIEQPPEAAIVYVIVCDPVVLPLGVKAPVAALIIRFASDE